MPEEALSAPGAHPHWGSALRSCDLGVTADAARVALTTVNATALEVDCRPLNPHVDPSAVALAKMAE